jgi:hypothetical protein
MHSVVRIRLEGGDHRPGCRRILGHGAADQRRQIERQHLKEMGGTGRVRRDRPSSPDVQGCQLRELLVRRLWIAPSSHLTQPSRGFFLVLSPRIEARACR